MHGEYKMPGGKLVIVDVEVQDEKITNLQISGDFFLEPAEALSELDGALDGVPTGTSAEEIAAILQRAIPEGALLVGFSPEGIATAVQRALQ